MYKTICISKDEVYDEKISVSLRFNVFAANDD
jgi:hypothetical protein